jgi:hypothetical protein
MGRANAFPEEQYRLRITLRDVTQKEKAARTRLLM